MILILEKLKKITVRGSTLLHVCNDSFANEEETVQASRHLEGNMQKLAYTCSIWERFNHLFTCFDFGGPPLCNYRGKGRGIHTNIELNSSYRNIAKHV